MPLRHQPADLTIQCLATIAKNFELLCYGVRNKKEMAQILADDSYLTCVGPFQQTPSMLLEKALMVIQEEKSIRHVQTRHLHVLIQPQLEALHLSFGSGDIHMAIDLIKMRCKKLQYLNIAMHRTIEPPVILKMIPCLCHIVKLNLSTTDTTDQIVATIGQNCPKLRDLDISGCSITEKGLSKLFWDARKKIKLGNKVTSVNVMECQMTPLGIRQGLQLQPNLRVLEFENNILAFDPLYVGVWEDELIFSLLSLYGNSAAISDPTMETVTQVCPFVTCLSLTSCSISDDTLLRAMAWDNLTSLLLTNNENESIHFTEAVLPILTARGSQLTTLLLSRFTYVDILMIGETCPILEKLAMSNISLYEDVTAAPTKDLFHCLQTLEVWSDLSNTSLTSSHLRLLLKAPAGLNNLLCSRCEHFGDNFLAKIWTDNPMKKLERITVDSCPNFSHISLSQLFDMDNILNFVRVWNCPHVTREHEKRLLQIIKERNMDAYLECYAWAG